jgi:F-type H+-transporting ATPase subunit b
LDALGKIGINLGYLIVFGLNFLVMLAILSALVYRPVLNALGNRRRKIAQGLEDARVAGEARANAEQEAARIINEAQVRAGDIVKEATERAEVAAREVEEQARADATKARDEALEQVKEERDRILSDLRGQVGSLAISVSNKLISTSLKDDERRQRQLIDEFFSGVREGRLQMLQGAELSGASAEVISALPLTPQEQDRVKQEVLSKIGSQSTVTFRVDPKLLGGLIIRVGDKVLDDSVAGQLSTLGQSLV